MSEKRRVELVPLTFCRLQLALCGDRYVGLSSIGPRRPATVRQRRLTAHWRKQRLWSRLHLRIEHDDG